MRKDRFDRNGERGSEEKNGVDPHHSYKNSTQLSTDIYTEQNMVHDDLKEANKRRNGKIPKFESLVFSMF